MKPFVGLLEMFGFEILQRNSLEQICINYASEALQKLFETCVLDEETRDYVAEGVKPQGVLEYDARDGMLEVFDTTWRGMFLAGEMPIFDYCAAEKLESRQGIFQLLEKMTFQNMQAARDAVEGRGHRSISDDDDLVAMERQMRLFIEKPGAQESLFAKRV